MRRTLVAALVVLSAGPALAKPPSIKLTNKQIATAARAARAKIKIDQKRSKQCANARTAPLETAACYRDAGNLELAIATWERIPKAKSPEAKDVEGAMHLLGPAYETIGSYPEAAQAYQAYAKAYPRAGDARDQLVRAICTWAQLGRVDYAASNLELLTRVWPKPVVDADHLCDTIRPIQPPAP